VRRPRAGRAAVLRRMRRIRRSAQPRALCCAAAGRAGAGCCCDAGQGNGAERAGRLCGLRVGACSNGGCRGAAGPCAGGAACAAAAAERQREAAAPCGAQGGHGAALHCRSSVIRATARVRGGCGARAAHRHIRGCRRGIHTLPAVAAGRNRAGHVVAHRGQSPPVSAHAPVARPEHRARALALCIPAALACAAERRLGLLLHPPFDQVERPAKRRRCCAIRHRRLGAAQRKAVAEER